MMYPADMHPNERHAYREVVRASKAAEWNRQQEEHFVRSKRKTCIVLIWIITVSYQLYQ